MKVEEAKLRQQMKLEEALRKQVPSGEMPMSAIRKRSLTEFHWRSTPSGPAHIVHAPYGRWDIELDPRKVQPQLYTEEGQLWLTAIIAGSEFHQLPEWKQREYTARVVDTISSEGVWLG